MGFNTILNIFRHQKDKNIFCFVVFFLETDKQRRTLRDSPLHSIALRHLLFSSDMVDAMVGNQVKESFQPGVWQCEDALTVLPLSGSQLDQGRTI